MYYELMQSMIEAIKGKNKSIQYYRALLEMTCDPEDKESIHKRILLDEIKHHKMFTILFGKYIGSLPVLPESELEIPEDYKKALEAAIKDELEAIDLYRSIMLATSDAYIRDSFFEAVEDETEHAIRLTFMYVKNK